MSIEITEMRVRSSAGPGLEAAIEAPELLLFCRDLRGTLTDVVVAAAGRALACSSSPTGRAVRSDRTGVGVLVTAGSAVLVPVVRNATEAPLPQVRAEVARLVEAARAGRLAPADVGGAIVTVSCEQPGTGVALREPPTGCVLTVDRSGPDSPELTLALSGDFSELGVSEAGRFFALLARLLRHPYRRLV